MQEETESPYQIDIEIETQYIEDESSPLDERFMFAYTITILNSGSVAAKLLTRKWLITDSNGKVQQVEGEGVVGEQPHINPGEGFRYTSGVVLETPVGSMEGSYQMIADDGANFDAEIPPFSLAIPHTLH